MTELNLRDRLRCPVCTSRLSSEGPYVCVRCGTRFPSVDGIPILINEANSLFRICDFVEKRPTYFDRDHDSGGWREKLSRLLYENSIDLKGEQLIGRFADLVENEVPSPHVLVIGSGIETSALHSLSQRPLINLVLTDVALTSSVAIVCDAHDIPFEDETFDGVIAQAVLEHVVDPLRCANEIHRVMKTAGIVFSDTPFMQQVHGGRYDFTRFTHLGHRMLFRRFEEIESGATGGPGAALIWSWRYFLLSFAGSRTSVRLLRIVAKLTSFWLKYVDHFLIDRPMAIDAASSTYFLGRKSSGATVSDRDLVAGAPRSSNL